jgi:hypothetical protein
MAPPDGLDPVVHVNGLPVRAAVVMVMVSPAPNPVTTMPPVTGSSGKPKSLLVGSNDTVGVIVNGVFTVLLPSDTAMVCEPPGRVGITTVVLKKPLAVVTRQGTPPGDE